MWVGLFVGFIVGAAVIYYLMGDIMASINELRSQVAELKSKVATLIDAIATEKAEITEALKRLSDLVEAGNVPADVVDGINEVSSSISTSVASVSDLVATPEPEPLPE